MLDGVDVLIELDVLVKDKTPGQACVSLPTTYPEQLRCVECVASPLGVFRTQLGIYGCQTGDSLDLPPYEALTSTVGPAHITRFQGVG